MFVLLICLLLFWRSIPRSRQIFFAKKLSISLCRGTVEVFFNMSINSGDFFNPSQIPFSVFFINRSKLSDHTFVFYSLFKKMSVLIKFFNHFSIPYFRMYSLIAFLVYGSTSNFSASSKVTQTNSSASELSFTLAEFVLQAKSKKMKCFFL